MPSTPQHERCDDESQLVHSSESSALQSPSDRQSNWLDLDGLVVQRSDTHHILIIEGMWVRLRPLDYQVLIPLLTHFNRPVSVEIICRDALGCPYSQLETRRVYRAIDRLRPQLGVFGLSITSLNKKRGYMLWRGDISAASNSGV